MDTVIQFPESLKLNPRLSLRLSSLQGILKSYPHLLTSANHELIFDMLYSTVDWEGAWIGLVPPDYSETGELKTVEEGKEGLLFQWHAIDVHIDQQGNIELWDLTTDEESPLLLKASDKLQFLQILRETLQIPDRQGILKMKFEASCEPFIA